MKHLNTYIEREDYGPFREFCLRHGERHEYKRREFFCRAGDGAARLGYIEAGGVHYIFADANGDIHTVGFSFEEDFAVDYPSFLRRRSPTVDIQALENCVIYTITRRQFDEFVDKNRATQRIVQRMSEELFITTYERLLAFYALTPEQRYLNLLAEYRDIVNRVPMKIIASFIGIAPESLSRIRQRIARKNKNISSAAGGGRTGGAGRRG